MSAVPDSVVLYLERRERALLEAQRLVASIAGLSGDPTDVDPDAGLFGNGLGLDSLDTVEILVGLDLELGIKLPGDDPIKLGIRNVNGIADAIMRARGELA
jgi:acyl carrier protein